MGKNINIPDLPDFLKGLWNKKQKYREPVSPFNFTVKGERLETIYRWDGKGRVTWTGSAGREVAGYNFKQVRENLEAGDWIRVQPEKEKGFWFHLSSDLNGPEFFYDGKRVWNADMTESSSWKEEEVEKYLEQGEWKKV